MIDAWRRVFGRPAIKARPLKKRPPPRRSPRLAAAAAGFRVKTVDGDGACLFRAVAQGMARRLTGHFIPTLAQETAAARDMRTLAVDTLCTTWQTVPATATRRASMRALRNTPTRNQMEFGITPGHCRLMRKPGTYGGHFEIQALCDGLYASIIVHDQNKPPLKFVPAQTHVNRAVQKNAYPIIHLRYTPGAVERESGAHFDLLY